MEITGERVSIAPKSAELNVDPKFASKPIKAAENKSNVNWQYSGLGFNNSGNAAITMPFVQQTSFGVSSNSQLKNKGSAVLQDDKLYWLDAGGNVLAFNRDNGDILWTNSDFSNLDTYGVFSLSDKFLSGGLLADGSTIYATAGVAEVIAIDAATGEKKWMTSLNSPVRATPLAVGDLLVVQATDNKLYALKKADGKVVWSTIGSSSDVGILAPAMPLYDGKMLYALLGSGELYVIDPMSGSAMLNMQLDATKAVFSKDKQVPRANSLMHREGAALFALTPSGQLFGISLNKEQIMWGKDLHITSGFWAAGDMLYAIVSDRHLIAVDKLSGNVRFANDLNGYVSDEDHKKVKWQTPFVAGGKVVVVNNLGKAIAFDLSSGEKGQEFAVIDGVYAEPAVTSNQVYLVSSLGSIVKYGNGK